MREAGCLLTAVPLRRQTASSSAAILYRSGNRQTAFSRSFPVFTGPEASQGRGLSRRIAFSANRSSESRRTTADSPPPWLPGREAPPLMPVWAPERSASTAESSSFRTGTSAGRRGRAAGLWISGPARSSGIPSRLPPRETARGTWRFSPKQRPMSRERRSLSQPIRRKAPSSTGGAAIWRGPKVRRR